MLETWLSSLEMTADVLVALGLDRRGGPPHPGAVPRPRREPVRADPGATAATRTSWREWLAGVANRGRQELERLFEEDAKERRSA
jgi:hypothetical protein